MNVKVRTVKKAVARTVAIIAKARTLIRANIVITER